MAELKCTDGTVLEINAETEAELRAAFGPKPEPTFEVGAVFWRAEGWCGCHYFYLAEENNLVALCDLLSHDGTIMNGWHQVQDICKITLDEVRKTTSFPKGLRHVPTENLVVTEK